jgi:hypothetical protein
MIRTDTPTMDTMDPRALITFAHAIQGACGDAIEAALAAMEHNKWVEGAQVEHFRYVVRNVLDTMETE